MNELDGAAPNRITPAPIPVIPVRVVTILRLNPPQTSKTNLPAIIPIPKRVSVHPNLITPFPNALGIIKGVSELLGTSKKFTNINRRISPSNTGYFIT